MLLFCIASYKVIGLPTIAISIVGALSERERATTIAIEIVGRMKTIKRGKEKRSYRSIYKTDTKNALKSNGV